MPKIERIFSLSKDDSSRSRISFLDTAKCLLVFWVVLVHIYYDYDPGSLPGWITYPYYMPAFFFISGIFHRERTFLEQLKVKTKALLIPFSFFYVVTYLWTWGFDIAEYLESGCLTDFQKLLSLSPGLSYATFNGALWFFLVLFLHSVLYTPLQHLFLKTYILIGALICLSIFGLYLWSKEIFPLAHFCYFYVFYSCGAEYGKKLLSIIDNSKLPILAFLSIFLLIVVNNIQNFVPLISYIPYALRQELAALIFIPIIFVFCFWLDKIWILNSVLRYMGKYSVVIFAIHMPYYGSLYSETMIGSGYLCKVGFFVILCTAGACLAAILNKYTPILIGKK